MSIRFVPCLVAASWLVAAITWAQPTLSHAVPAAVRPGQSLEITLHGAKLDGGLQSWSSFPAKIEFAPQPADAKDATSRVCKITVDPQVPIGIGGIVVGNATGASDPLFVMVDDLPSLADGGQNHTVEQAQAVSLPAAVDGICDGPAFDYYRFAGKKDQRISVELVAERMNSTLDPVLRLVDANRHELIAVDDDVSLGADCRFSTTLPADGDYVLEVRDNQYRTGGRYRLRMGDFPLVSVPYPLGGRFGSTTRFRFSGPLAENAEPVFLRIPDSSPKGRQSIAAKLPQGQSSGMATMVTSRLPDVMEVEPNDDWSTAATTTLPCAVNGMFHTAQDRDYFQFAATKGQSLLFRAVSRSVGSPCFLLLRIVNASGQQLAESAVDDSDESSVSLTFPADGMYAVVAEELLHRSGPDFAYRVEAESNHGFTLTLKQDKDTRTRFQSPVNNGALACTVTVARRGFEGPIDLEIEAETAGYSLINGRIPDKSKEHQVVIVPPAGQTPGSLHVWRLIGSTLLEGRPFRCSATTVPTLKARWPQMSYPPGWIDGLFTTAVGGELAPFFQIAVAANPLKFPRAQGTVPFDLTLERKNADFKGNINLFVQGLPNGFTSAIKADKDTYKITITGPKDSQPARHLLKLVAYGELNGSGQLVTLELPCEIE